jgi:hypothetical protein
MRPFSRLFSLLQILRTLGWRWVLFRVWYFFFRRSGLLARRTPLLPWSAFPDAFAENSVEPKLSSALLPPEVSAAERETALAEGNAIIAGKFLLFSFHRRELGRFPQWNKSPLDASLAPAEQHWSTFGDFGFGDIKSIWELSRWPWAFALANAALAEQRREEEPREDAEKFAERFWELAEDWFENNPPNRGVNWKCGQEASFRLFASVFAIATFGKTHATTPARLQKWRRFVWATGKRIEANLSYALSQSNNHGISECAGLLTAGLLVGGKQGERWFSRAEKKLRKQLAELVYPDGGFSQHSAVYHRVALDDLIWTEKMFAAANKKPPAWLTKTRERLAFFFDKISDFQTGNFFHYGASDGSNILPITHSCRASSNATTNTTNAPAPRSARHFADAGVLIWKHGDLSLLFRCPTVFRHRPSHADLLHIAVRWRGRDILLSPGSFSYNPPSTDKRFSDPQRTLASAFSHNSATLENCDQMKRISRFLYLPWAQGKADWETPEKKTFIAKHFGYWKRFQAVHQRKISLHEDGKGFTVEDTFSSKKQNHWRLHWLLTDGNLTTTKTGAILHFSDGDETASDNETAAAGTCTIAWQTENLSATDAPEPSVTEPTVTSELNPKTITRRADPTSALGWHSPHYQELPPANALALELPPATRKITTRFRFE